MDRATKEKLKAEFSTKFSAAGAGFLAEYRGLKVGDITKLRVELKKHNADFRVLKNRVARKAVEELPGFKALSPSMKGPIGVVLAMGDAAQAAKTILNFEKDTPALVVKGGVMDGQLMSTADVKALSDLPSREVLMTRLVSSLVSPHRGLLGVLNAVSRDLVQVVNAIKEKKA